MSVPNVLATRYASPQMQGIWSPEAKIVAERRLWLAVLEAQRDLGVDFGGDDPDAVLADYRAVVEQVDLASIAARERVTRHDVKARIEEFNDLAGHEHVHKGMTSRDLTENVEQYQVLTSLKLVRERVVTVLVALARLAVQHRDTAMAGRSHNVAAQATTLGKRFATAIDELLVAYDRLGFGRSDPHPGTLALDFIASEAEGDFATVLRALGIPRFIVFGHSVGGGMAVNCAAHHGAACVA